jgi:dUTP pyrophosphatase
MNVMIKRLTEGAQVPTYATLGSACFDIHVDGSTWPERTKETGLQIHPYAPYHLSTGLAFEIPSGHVMLVFSRSGHGFNRGVRLSNCTGVIDSDYRGELKVSITNDMPETRFVVKPGDRIAQGMILPIAQVHFVFSDELSQTERGEGGMGSTGA